MPRIAKLTLTIKPEYIAVCGNYDSVTVTCSWIGVEGELTVQHKGAHIMSMALTNENQELHATLEGAGTLWDNPLALIAASALGKTGSPINIAQLNDATSYIRPVSDFDVFAFIKGVS